MMLREQVGKQVAGMPFLDDSKLNSAIRKITRGSKVRCAVAFWGEGAMDLFSGLGRHEQKVRIVCNLKSGGTNPSIIERLEEAGAEIRQHDALHAKVYIGEDQAIVASANASANGLGFEGVEQARWIEAGVKLEDKADIQRVLEWFEGLWRRSREITAADIMMAKATWERRRVSRPRLNSFADFDVEAKTLPLISWVIPCGYEICKQNVENQLGFYNDKLERRIDNGIEVEDAKDEKLLLRPGTWVLCWQRANSGLPDRCIKPWWVFLGSTIVRKAFLFSGDKQPRDAVLQAEQSPPEPFDATDPLFLQALRDVLSQDEYSELRCDDYEGAWFALRQELMCSLWRDLKTRYCELVEKANSPQKQGPRAVAARPAQPAAGVLSRSTRL